MARNAPAKVSRGAVATGASATGVASLAAMAMGAVAIGALAVGALAVGRLSIGRARLRRVEIGELTVGRLALGAGTGGRLTAVLRVRAAPGRGDALAHLLADPGKAAPGSLIRRARRSRHEPDRFLFCETYADEAAFDRHAEAPRLDALLRQAAGDGLLADDGPPEVELYRAF
jgi:quinol monooxygenase YgiN